MENPGILRDGELMLRPATMDDVAVAENWYRDPEVLRFSEGTDEPYSLEKVTQMYRYLLDSGYFFIIEILQGDTRIPIGDACLMHDSVPIVIGVARYRSSGYGRRVLSLLIDLANQLEWTEVKVKGVFYYNERSIRLFESLGFSRTGERTVENGLVEYSYRLVLI